MKTFLRYLLLACILFLAIHLYSLGISTGTFALVVLALAVESVFWIGLFKKNKKKSLNP